jgi:hypothetical protein
MVVTVAAAVAVIVAMVVMPTTVTVMSAAMAMIVVPAAVAMVIMAAAMPMILVAATMAMVVMPTSVMIAGSVGYGACRCARHEKAAHSFGIPGSAVENQRLQKEQHTDHNRVAEEKRSDEAPEPCILISRQM